MASVLVSKHPSQTSNPELELFGGAAITHEAGQAWAEPGVEAHDVRDGNITSSGLGHGYGGCQCDGDLSSNYSVADAAGNTDSATRTVTVVVDPAPRRSPCWVMPI